MNAGRELDALVAEKVMGDETPMRECATRRVLDSEYGGPSHYSTSIADAWKVFCKFPSRYLGYDDATDTWFCILDTTRRVMGDCRFRATSEDDTGALAICLAALRVRGYEWWRVHDATR